MDIKCDLCEYIFEDSDEKFFHGYQHYGIEGLEDFARAHKTYITKPFDMTAFQLQGCPCRSFNFPVEPNSQITTDMIQGYLL